jgi:O-antigen/teichoic acid export membrane protein
VERVATQPSGPSVPEAKSELPRFEGRFPGLTGDLRRHTARGTIINAAFRVSVAVLSLLRRVLVAAFLTPSELGVWGIVLITLMTLMFVKSVGISDKFIQQSESDQEVAFQKAFTIELLITLAFGALAVALIPAFAFAYGEWSIVAPALVLLLAVVGNSFQAPIWIFYRQMKFVRQRSLEAVDPVIAFVVTIGLAAAGAGYWSLVVGLVAGSWAGGLAAIRACPYRLRLRVDWSTVREYFSFSWPLAAAQIGALVVAQGSILVGVHTVGVAGVGVIALAASITAFSTGVDSVITQTLYPAICAVRDRTDLMLESFVKSNRLALMWGMPFGLGLALFASDLVHFVIGEDWLPAVFVLQLFGVMVAIDQLGFNWTAFMRARNYTRPLASVGLVMAGSFCVITIPLLLLGGLKGYAIGMLAMTVVTLAARMFYLGRLFSGFRMFWHAGRAIAPSIPPLMLVLALRLVEPGARTLGIALAELAVYIAVTVAATLIFERALIREIVGYLRRSREPDAGPGAGAQLAHGHSGA